MAQEQVAKAKVATVVTENLIALNIGEAAGIREADIVTLYRDVEVSDPDTSEKLGVVHLPKLKLAVTEVHDRWSVARVTSRFRNGDRTTLASILGGNTKRITKNRSSEDRELVYVTPGESADVSREIVEAIETDVTTD